MVRKLSVILLLISLSASVRAEDAPASAPKDATQPELTVRNKNESWYLNLGLGWASSPNYGSKTNSEIDALKAAGTGFKRTPVLWMLAFTGH